MVEGPRDLPSQPSPPPPSTHSVFLDCLSRILAAELCTTVGAAEDLEACYLNHGGWKRSDEDVRAERVGRGSLEQMAPSLRECERKALTENGGSLADGSHLATRAAPSVGLERVGFRCVGVSVLLGDAAVGSGGHIVMQTNEAGGLITL